MKLVVILPALDEERTVGEIVRQVPRRIEGIETIEVIVVDDGSQDRTAVEARGAGAQVVSHAGNLGVGVAFHTGVDRALRAGADVIVNMDADGQFDPAHIPDLIQPILDGRADMATASRFKDRRLIPKMPFAKRVGNAGMARLVSFLVGERFYDVACGFRAYSRTAALHLNLFGHFTYTQESFLDLSGKGYRIVEVPLSVRGEREFGESRVAGSLSLYALRTLQIIRRSVLDYQPLKIIGSLAAACFLAGLLLLGFLARHYLTTGHFTPYKAVGFVGGFLLALGLIILTLALVADILVRLRLNQERLLFLFKEHLAGSLSADLGPLEGSEAPAHHDSPLRSAERTSSH